MSEPTKMVLGMRTTAPAGDIVLRLVFKPNVELSEEKRQEIRERFSGAMRGLFCSLPDGLAPGCVVVEATDVV